MFKGIDVSSYQGIIDWESVKNNIDFAILRCGYGDDCISQDDRMFKRNADECTRLGIPFGVYIFCYAADWDNIRSEVLHTLRMINGYHLSYPVFLDLEDSKTIGSLNPCTIGDYAQYFCSEIQKAGYYPAIYANKYWFTSILTDKRFEKWDKWVAQYYTECTYDGTYTMWQYSSDGHVDGINGRVDMNICYVDYPAIIGNASVDSANNTVNNADCISSDITTEDSTSSSYEAGSSISNGSVVRFTGNADYYGTPVKAWHDTYICDEPYGDRVVLRADGAVFAAVNIKDVVLC